MKIKMLLPIALVLCLAFSLCACGTTSNTAETTIDPIAATETATAATTTAAPVTEAKDETTTADFTEEDALELVKNSHSFGDEYYFQPRGIVEVDGVSYYAIDLRKSLDTTTTYITSYFVTLDGSEILDGYFANNEPVIGKTEATLNITEDNAVKAVEAAYDFEEDCYFTLRGTEEIDGVTYFAVDLRKSLEDHSTYLSTFFVTENGTIVEGYYEGGTPVLAE